MNSKSLSFVCSLVTLTLSLAVAPLRAQTESRTGYETGLQNDNNGLIGVVEPRPESVTASRDYSRSGVWSLRSELNYGETTDVGIRAECNQHSVYTSPGVLAPIVQRNVRRFYGFSVLLDPTPGNYDYDATSEVIMQQKHGGGEALFQLLTDGGQFKCWNENHDSIRRRTTIGNYEKGIWYDFVFEHLPSYLGNGVMRLYWKKASVANYTLAMEWLGPTLAEDADGYFKWGMYKANWATATASKRRVVYHDNVKVGKTFADADPVLMPPIAPEGLLVNNVGGGMDLDWGDSPEKDFATYRVYRSNNDAGPFVEIARGLTASRYLDSAVTTGAIYYYVVTTMDTQGLESSYSKLGSNERESLLKLTAVAPRNVGGGGSLTESAQTMVVGSANLGGTVSCPTSASIPVIPDSNPALYARPNSSFYVMKVAGATLAGVPNVTVSYKLKLTASTGDGLLVYKGAFGWTVDRGQNGGADGAEYRALNSNETIKAEVVEITVSDPNLSATFAGFTSGTFLGGSGPTFNLATSVATGAGTGISGFSLATLAFNLRVNVIPRAPVVNDAVAQVSEGAASGTEVLTVPASDPNYGDTLTYAITGGGDGRFAINALSGKITTANRLDYETKASHVLTVKVTDQAGLSDTAAITVNVSNVANDDSDSDGLTDEWEIVNFGSVTAQIGSGDADGDHFTNAMEEQSGSDPMDATDGELFIEAEQAIAINCTSSSYYAGFSGSGYMVYGAGGSLQWSFNAAAAGTYLLAFHHLTASQNSMTLDVNGIQTSYTLTGTSGAWANSTPVPVTLKVGVNSVRLLRVSGGDYVRLDRLVIASDAGPNPGPAMQITSYKRTSPTTSSLTFTSVAGRSYVVESSETLQANSWQSLREFVAESDQTAVNFSHPSASRLFFRIRKVP